MGRSLLKYHLLALFTILVWGTTFTSTKVLILHGLTPVEIMFYRFSMAYAVCCFFVHKPLFAIQWRDEAKMILLGLCGGSLYFVFENSALEVTYTSNVALILCITPLITALLTVAFFRDQHFTWKLAAGSAFAVAGVCCVVLNGNFVFRFSPVGDGLALSASLCWAFYSVLLKPLTECYSILFITRKVFFYGAVTVLPLSLLFPDSWHIRALTSPVVFGNLLFLGVIASMLCFFSWNIVISRLGIIRANNYMYTQPVVSLLCGVLVLHERISWIALSGGLFIVSGIYVAQNGLRFRRHIHLLF